MINLSESNNKFQFRKKNILTKLMIEVEFKVKTKYSSKSELLKYIKNSDFFFNFVKILKRNPSSKNHKFVPNIVEGEEVEFPVELFYSEVPGFKLPFAELLEIDIHEKWSLDENSFKTIINVSLKGNKLCTIKTVFTIALGKNSDKIILKSLVSIYPPSGLFGLINTIELGLCFLTKFT